jgi:hypothetical protein
MKTGLFQEHEESYRVGLRRHALITLYAKREGDGLPDLSPASDEEFDSLE